MKKSDIRKEVIVKRRKLSKDDIKYKSDAIFLNIKKYCLNEKNIDTVLLYSDYNGEVSTEVLYDYFSNKGSIIAYPKILDLKSGIMEFYEIKDKNMLQKSELGISEPSESCQKCDAKKGIIIVPLVAFDEKCMRIGYGGGFYDRYLEKHSELTSIGVAYDFQLYNDFEINGFDKRLDYIVTESKIYGGYINE